MSSIRAARSRLPGEFVAELYRAFPVNLAERILMGMARRRRVTLRVNTIKASAVEVMEEFRSEGVKYQRVQWYPDAFVITNKSERDLGSLPSYREGRIYLQSLSSMVPPLVLAPRAGDEVLDIAAAPGSKATQMAALMENRGRIVAVDVDRVRAQRLAFNVERQGAGIVEVVAGVAGLMLVLPLLGVVMVVGETMGRLITNPRLRARHRNALALRTRQASADLAL